MAQESSRRFWRILMLLLVLATGVRVAYVLGVADGFNSDKFYDAAYYELEARTVANGDGFADPFRLLPGADQAIVPDASHPPLTVLVLAPIVKVFDGQLILRFASALAGLGVVFLSALLAREVAGDRAGLIAAFIAAVYPFLWVNDGLIMSESFTGVAVVGTVLATYKAARSPEQWWRWLLVGALGGISALGRAELVLLVPVIAAGVLLAPLIGVIRVRLMASALAGVALLLVLAPWFIYNSARFETRVILSTNDGLAMVASNCDEAYSGDVIGLTFLRSSECLPAPPRGDQSVVAEEYRRVAFEYMSDNASRVPVVVLARLGRDWSLFRPADMLSWNIAEGRPRWVTSIGLAFYYPLLLGAFVGAFILWRRKRWIWPLLAPGVVVSLGAIFAYGQIRFRAPAEPFIVILCAVALSAIGNKSRISPVSEAVTN
ncbi:MAG: glycosyltransferase family 39 protein [Acidimicrobiia bacterium]|nr:glycosyltransferase family 39 protein [Acidimicrobiia bacterium]